MKRTVYVIESCYAYEGGSVSGVASTLRRAQALAQPSNRKKLLKWEDNEDGTWTADEKRGSWAYYQITKMKIDSGLS